MSSNNNDGNDSANKEGTNQNEGQSGNRSGSKTPTTSIKIASTNANVGPGDPLAAPSVAPEAVDIPQPPTASQLVVKSVASKGLKTIKTIDNPVSKSADSESAMSAQQGGGSSHDEIEEGEGEVEHPAESPSSPASASAAPSAASAGASGQPMSPTGSAGGMDTPASSGGGSPKLSPKTSGHRSKSPSAHPSSGRSSGGQSSGGHSSGAHSSSTRSPGGRKKKVTKFRYHKRITVRTHGKTSPSTVMDKVTKKDHLTPSTIGELDPQELMRRAGIKTKKAHWRVRLRQTKRLTKGGKTVSETKVAYRDSEGNKRVTTLPDEECKKCGKKPEDCKCKDF